MAKKTHFNGNLEVTVIDIIEVPSRLINKQEPYCVVTLGSSGPRRFLEGTTFGKEKFQTEVFKGNLERPTWNETHVLNLNNMTLDSHLKVKLYDKDVNKDDFIGEAKINLEELLPVSQKGMKYYPLCHWTKVMGTNRQECVGQVGISVAFDCSAIPQSYFDEKLGDIAIQRTREVDAEGAEGIAPPMTTPQYLQMPVGHATQHDVTEKVPEQTGVSQYGQTDTTRHGQIHQENITDTSYPQENITDTSYPQSVEKVDPISTHQIYTNYDHAQLARLPQQQM